MNKQGKHTKTHRNRQQYGSFQKEGDGEKGGKKV